MVKSPASNAVMDQSAVRVVARPPKPGAGASMNAAQRDALEHQIRCQCGCTLDVYTCRTTDFTCQVSPSMHHDVQALVAGGYDAQEILDAFVEGYGERALMAPRKEGFNLVGYVAPFVALGVGALTVGSLLKRWQRPAIVSAAPLPARSAGVALPLDATPEELARLETAVREDA
jgi:cytochrome c-type biogenesis protein CcmH